MSEQKEDVLKQIQSLEEQLRDLKRSMLAFPIEQVKLSFPLNALVLSVGDLSFALPVDRVEEVTEMVFISSLPGAPKAIRGTFSYRGRLVPVLDIRQELAGSFSPFSPDMFLAIVTDMERTFALAVDRVQGVHNFKSEDLDSAPVLSSMPSFVHGVLRNEHRPVILLQPAGLLAAGELELLQELLCSAQASTEANQK